ncbi:MAG: hypothetical protein SGILL_001347 [Bacillariaceae sp.]
MSGDPSNALGEGSAALDDGGADKKHEKEKKQGADGSAILLQFPSTATTELSPHLAPLRDNHSNYSAVAKACLILNQFAANGSAATIEDSTCIDSSALFHDVTFVESLSEAFAALLDCIGQHDDRRAKIVACKTAALMARSAYARLRHSPHLFSVRDATTNHRLEDEVGTDIPAALVTCALEDADEGVAANAMSSLGILVLSTTSTPGTLVDDELLSEVLSIVQAGSQPSAYAPSLRALVDEDQTTSQTELQSRIFDNILSPRLLQLVSRFQAFENPSNMAIALPTLTASLVYLSKIAPPMTYHLDRTAYAKRWVELDFVSLIETVVETILFPLLKSNTGLSSGGCQNGAVAALSAIRLVHASPASWWVREVIEWAVLTLKEEYNASPFLESRMTMLASIVVASRVLPLPDRVTALEFLAGNLQTLPSTSMAPHGVVSAGLLLETEDSMFQYRTPTRPALWAEIALGFFMDGPVEAPNNNSFGNDAKLRNQSLVKFLKSSKIAAILKDSGGDSSGNSLREEMVMTFCTVACQVGRRHKVPEEGGGPHLTARSDQLEEWAGLSLTLLQAMKQCIGWGSSPYMDEEMTILVACQAAYTRLLQELIHAAGLLTPSSVSVKMTPFSGPPTILWDQMEEAADFFVRYEAMSPLDNLIEPIGKLVDDIVKKELKGSGIVSHHMRLFILSHAADQWVQARYIASQKTQSSDHSMNVESAKQILVAICPRRMFSKVVESNKSQVESFSKSKKERYKKYCQDLVTVCVACIENMALMVCDYTKRFGNSNDTKMLLNASVQSLQGKSGSDADAPVLPVCQGAIERVQAAFQAGPRGSRDSVAVSTLIPTDFRRRPVISSSRITQGRDAFNEGYLVQLARQIIAARSDRCIWSFPPVATFPSSTRKQNWLRLSLPPLPQGRNPQMAIESIPRFAWGSNVVACTAGSDPVSVTLAYSTRRSLRYDGADEFRLMVSMRVHNLAAAEVSNGLRLELGVSEESVATSEDGQDNVSIELAKALSEGFDDSGRDGVYGSSVAVYRNAVKSGDHVTWEMVLNPLPMTGAIKLQPSLMFRALENEAPHACWVTASDVKKQDEETSVTSGLSQKSGGSMADGGDAGGRIHKPDIEQKQNVVVPCQEMNISPMIGLQPCPFVFYRDGCGDVDSFRTLWTRMPLQLPPLKLDPMADNFDPASTSFDAMRLAAISSVAFPGDPVPGGMITDLWAFMSPRGNRAMFVLAEQNSDKSKTLHVRGDDRQLLLCLIGTSASRNAVISTLQPGMKLK